jgi:hypothetical protein
MSDVPTMSSPLVTRDDADWPVIEKCLVTPVVSRLDGRSERR